MPTLPLCFQNSSSLHMSCFKPNRAGNQEGQAQLTSPLPLLLLSVTPSWGNARLRHCVSKQRWDQDALAPFSGSTKLLLVWHLTATGRLWLGCVLRQTHGAGREMKLPAEKHALLFHRASNHRAQSPLKQAYLNQASGHIYPAHKGILFSILQMEKLGHREVK